MDRLRLNIGAPAHGGYCVARHEGRVVLVRHTLPGEVVMAAVTDGEPEARFWRADAVEILEPSPDRVPSVWPQSGPRVGDTGGVGGGELAHVALAAQRVWKKDVLVDALARFAKTEAVFDVVGVPGDDEAGGLRYRTRVSAIGNGQGRASMRGYRSHEACALESMPLATPAAEAALLGGKFPSGSDIQVVDASGEDSVRVLVDGEPWRLGSRDRRANAPTHVKETVTVGGQTYAFKVGAGAFWQVHRGAAAVLANEVLARVGDAGRVLELYAGSGLFTVPLAATGREVTSVESHEGAVRDARRNLHAYPDATVWHGDVRQTIRTGLGAYDAIVLDPPRSGAGKATLEAIAPIGATTIVYVACDPVALARDVSILRDLGYDLSSIAAHDLFPMTHHVESVATFARRSGSETPPVGG